ncbi:complement C1q-like protein 2 isoform X1 [Salminus brasiliensis]|uniref:complement C1q-like protein 2 isoform X1 n=1 Tax=Salminus brasiliensis TaxID=930266 RepID=UPI003B82F68D
MEETLRNQNDLPTHLTSMMEELKQKNGEQAKELEVLRGNVSEMLLRMDELAKKTKDPKVAFSASLLNSESPSNVGPFDSNTTLIYRHIFTNVGGAYDPATGLFSAPVKGVYAFRVFSKAFGRSDRGVTAGLFKNGQHIFSTHAHQTEGVYGASNGVTLQLEKGDLVSVQLYPGSWICDNKHHHSTFSGHLLFLL